MFYVRARSNEDSGLFIDEMPKPTQDTELASYHPFNRTGVKRFSFFPFFFFLTFFTFLFLSSLHLIFFFLIILLLCVTHLLSFLL